MNKWSTFLNIFISCYLILLQVSVALNKGQARIINGTSTTIAEAPYLVQIIFDGEFLCGGTLVSPKHVVTAAHCVYRKTTKRLIVASGISRLSLNTDGYRSKVKRKMIPTSYDYYSHHYDVAVLKLVKSLRGSTVKTTSLCKKNFRRGDPAKLFGWGILSENATSNSDQVQTIDIEVVAKRICRKSYRKEGLNITNTMFCASGLGKDSCNGDSGGPVMVNDDFCGIVSWAIDCAVDKYPGVNTDIRAVLPFIEAAMKL